MSPCLIVMGHPQLDFFRDRKFEIAITPSCTYLIWIKLVLASRSHDSHRLLCGKGHLHSENIQKAPKLLERSSILTPSDVVSGIPNINFELLLLIQ
ncbi:hypothetical protein AVEN_270190-1 [Araneus ventricosus]|uniref:Uncharacterized protein n=1 Tax=Araneus ventricosus TaxID=182803 RepID=A0A4Y2T6N4_ARAVE|nr:hypothetical protein AVEN_90199-1 [Araneus ventricosus]GBN95156.1 hypothetical protein AVEN_270190-1 [Araneus ventricosus]